MILTVFLNWNHSVLFLYLISALDVSMKVSLLEASDLLLSVISCPVVLWDLLILWPMVRGDVSPGSSAQGSPNTVLLEGVRKSHPCSCWAATLSLSGCTQYPIPKSREKPWSCTEKTVTARAIGKEIKSLSAPQETHIWNDQLDVCGIEAKTT